MREPYTIDARGLSCPQPVLLTRQVMKETKSTEFHVLVDTKTSRDNCARIAEKNGWSVAADELPEGGYELVVTK